MESTTDQTEVKVLSKHSIRQTLSLRGSGSVRDAYLAYINQVLVTAATKFEHRQTKNREKIEWARVILKAVATGNTVLKARELDDLTRRIAQLEARVTS